jgi:hypothetical protein
MLRAGFEAMTPVFKRPKLTLYAARLLWSALHSLIGRKYLLRIISFPSDSNLTVSLRLRCYPVLLLKVIIFKTSHNTPVWVMLFLLSILTFWTCTSPLLMPACLKTFKLLFRSSQLLCLRPTSASCSEFRSSCLYFSVLNFDTSFITTRKAVLLICHKMRWAIKLNASRICLSWAETIRRNR